MKNDLIEQMTKSFEGHAQKTEKGIEYWLARDVQHLRGYAKWQNFLHVISKAKTTCELSGHNILDHFFDVKKTVELGSGSQRKISDITPMPFHVMPALLYVTPAPFNVMPALLYVMPTPFNVISMQFNVIPANAGIHND